MPLWQNILFYFSIGLTLSFLVGDGVLYYFTKKAAEDAKNIKIAIEQGKTQQILNLENLIKSYRDRIDEFSSLVANHKLSSNFFGESQYKTGILEKDTHPKVMFNEMTFNVRDNTITLSGVTETFEILAQQVVLFQNDKMVKSVKTSKADTNKEGKIEFTLDIVFDPALLKSFCGNEVIEGEEQCEWKNGVLDDSCTAKCTLK